MTRKSFYRKLRRVANQFTWRINRDGSLRGRIGKRSYCPITAVVKACKDVEYKLDDFYCAGDDLLLGFQETENIVKAADHDTKNLPGKEKRIRQALIRAVTNE